MKKIKALLFDMDGVLIDAKEWHYEALNKALGLFGLEITRYEHTHNFDGLPTKKKLSMISEETYLPMELHSFINNLKQDYTLDEIMKKCKPTFQHEYALSKLKSEGYKIAVCSNSIKSTIMVMMEKAGLMEYIDLILSNEDVLKPKPDPEIYISAMKWFNISPKECLIMEDNKNGIKAAIESGGNLLKINDVFDVNYSNIKRRIRELEGE